MILCGVEYRLCDSLIALATSLRNTDVNAAVPEGYRAYASRPVISCAASRLEYIRPAVRPHTIAAPLLRNRHTVRVDDIHTDLSR